jgi:hypothetical protein
LDTTVLIVGIIAAALFLPVIWLWHRWVVKRLTNRLLADVLASSAKPDEPSSLKPESDFIVDVTDEGATCSRPDGKTESVKWSDLQRVEILTTDDGPFAPDVFWVLFDTIGGCVIPWGATGDRELMNRLQSLPGFRNDVIIDAASLTTNNRLLCWERNNQSV